jgi:DNA-directed RNA polymerase specialized sigma24 family protein
MIDMAFKNFKDYLNVHKRNIQIICSSIDSTTDYKIEYEDLYQEAILKLLDNYMNGKPTDVNFTKRSIKNHLINYVKKNIKGKRANIDLDNYLYALKKSN